MGKPPTLILLWLDVIPARKLPERGAEGSSGAAFGLEVWCGFVKMESEVIGGGRGDALARFS